MMALRGLYMKSRYLFFGLVVVGFVGQCVGGSGWIELDESISIELPEEFGSGWVKMSGDVCSLGCSLIKSI